MVRAPTRIWRFKDVTNLGNTGYFSEVNPVFTTVPEGVKLDFAVTVNPVTTGEIGRAHV